MNEYEKKAVEDKKRLDKKIVWLSALIYSDRIIVRNGVDEREKMLIQKQLPIMMAYSDVLGERIEHYR